MTATLAYPLAAAKHWLKDFAPELWYLGALSSLDRN
jgi:hypothetical protein